MVRQILLLRLAKQEWEHSMYNVPLTKRAIVKRILQQRGITATSDEIDRLVIIVDQRNYVKAMVESACIIANKTTKQQKGK